MQDRADHRRSHVELPPHSPRQVAPSQSRSLPVSPSSLCHWRAQPSLSYGTALNSESVPAAGFGGDQGQAGGLEVAVAR
jgi:hypothetical protein